MSTQTAVLGLGIIGEIWARNLDADGFGVRTWNRTPKPDAPGHTPDIRAAVEGAKFIFIVVADPPAVDSVLAQIEPVLRPGQTVIQSATIDPASSRAFAERVHATGAAFLEAPFTGSKPAAEARQTVFYIGGAEATLAAAREVLEPISKAIFHFGEVGQAAVIKLAVNINAAMMAEALCETVTFTRSQGIADARFFEALSQNVGRSGLSDLKEEKLKQRDYATQFSIKHMGKDLRLALTTAGTDGPAAALPMLRRLVEQYDRAEADGLGDLDFIGLVKLLGD